ncbi:RES family NAD+ phosphorylase [Fibrella sp. WM1]|uniref:RES family NAD+ phosphorylase n=1 Tax=Fibrella musci TaxID=3242485 RepID=UPI00352052EF
MKLYRLSKRQFASDVGGTGGLYGAGRWHRQGTRLLYTSEHASLAILEILGNSEILPKNYALITYDVPDQASMLTLSVNDLPANWTRSPAPTTLADLAEHWLEENRYWLMRVPSVHSPVEFNYLLNPLHPEHSNLRIVGIEPYSFDERLK